MRCCCCAEARHICTHSRCRAHHGVHSRRKDVNFDNCLRVSGKNMAGGNSFALHDTAAHPPTPTHNSQWITCLDWALSTRPCRDGLCCYGAEPQTAAVEAREAIGFMLSCMCCVHVIDPNKEISLSSNPTPLTSTERSEVRLSCRATPPKLVIC